ncbi:MAG: DUF2946 family protein [Azoarcus sp.]|jgi:hypothetical protein|nr:DUF2946 family protein [Azoarcus sp.]
MRRLFAILFLICLPLQLGWASAAAYCQHEYGVAADHFGHHGHPRAGESGGEGDPAPMSGADCGFCHVACAAALLPEVVRMSVLDARQVHALSSYPPPRLAPSARRERPKWLFPA